MARLYRRGSVYWIDYFDGPQRIRRSLGTTSKTLAQLKKAQLETHHLPRRRDRASLSLTEAFERYSTAAQFWQSRTVQIHTRGRLARWSAVLPNQPCAALTANHIETGLQTLTAQHHLNATTQRHYLKHLRACCRWLLREGHLWHDPTAGIRLPTPIQHSRLWLTTDQREDLLRRAKGSHYYPMILCALYTGLRWRELVTLEWADVDFERNLVHVRPKAHWSPKSRKARVIPLHPRLRALLERLGGKEGVIFCTPRQGAGRGTPYKTDSRSQVLRPWLEAMGIRATGTRWHALRHSFASHLIQAGVSVYKVKEWLGHANVATTQVYAHLAPAYDDDIRRL